MLGQLGVETYIPMFEVQRIRRRKVVVARQPLFPGYLFLFVVSGRSLYELRRAPGVRQFVSAGKVPIAVPQRGAGPITDKQPDSVTRTT